MDERELEWACGECPKRKLHPYTRKLLDVRTLQLSGFRMRNSMLTYTEWMDLGRVNQWLETPRL